MPTFRVFCWAILFLLHLDLFVIFLFYGGFIVEKVRLLLSSTRSSLGKSCTKFACCILLYVLYFPIFGQQ